MNARRFVVVAMAAGGWLSASCVWCSGTEPARAIGGSTQAARDTEWSAERKSATAALEAQGGRIREGSKLTDQIGEFQKTGDQVSFFGADGSGALRVLENLALERVMRTIEDHSERRTWSVSGLVTEFRGENYLLLTRAVLTAAPRDGTPATTRGRDLSPSP